MEISLMKVGYAPVLDRIGAPVVILIHLGKVIASIEVSADS
jgi:hypothetical protein